MNAQTRRVMAAKLFTKFKVMNNFAFISGIIGFVELLIWWLTDKQVPQ